MAIAQRLLQPTQRVLYPPGPPIMRGRNAEKRRVGKGWTQRVTAKPVLLNEQKSGFWTESSAKRNTFKRTQLLADRRLRQRGLRPSY